MTQRRPQIELTGFSSTRSPIPSQIHDHLSLPSTNANTNDQHQHQLQSRLMLSIVRPGLARMGIYLRTLIVHSPPPPLISPTIGFKLSANDEVEYVSDVC